MPKMICKTCGYSTDLTDEQVRIGMVCPECFGQKLRPARHAEEPPIPWHQRLKPATFRALLGGVLGLGFGIFFLLIGLAILAPRYNIRWTGLGLFLFGAGVYSLIDGLVRLKQDRQRPS